MSKAQKNFLSGALILTIANALVNLIGALYKIPLANLVDTTGMNYYNDGYQIYALLFVLSTAGVPVAISKMVSEAVALGRKNEPKRILKNGLLIFGLIGLVLAALMVVLVRPLSGLLQNGDTVNWCIAFIAPSIFFVCISSVVKGYFQGYKCMTPTAYFQVIEAAFKLVGIAVIWILIKKGYGGNYMVLACGGTLGVTFGSFAASLFMVVRYLAEKDFGKFEPDSLASFSGRQIRHTIVTLAIPISLSSAVMSVTSTLDMFLVKFSLKQYGLPLDQVKATYGAYTGATASLFNLPPSITITVGIAVLPFLTTAFARKQPQEAFRNMRSASKVVSLMAMPCAMGMSVMSAAIIRLLYNRSYWEVGVPGLRYLAISIFFVSFVSLTGVFLQSVGRVRVTLFTMAAGAVMKLTINLIMVSKIGILGAPLGTFACYFTILSLNTFFIRKYMNFRFPYRLIIVKPLICSAVCCGTAYGVWWGLLKLLGDGRMQNAVALAGALVLAIAVYAVLVLMLRVLDEDDMILLPKGEKIAALLKRKGWLG